MCNTVKNVIIGKIVEDQTVLSDLGVLAGQTVEVEIQSTDPIHRPLEYHVQASPSHQLPEKLTVKVDIGKTHLKGCIE